jgi:hypothetical protein
MSSNTTCPTDDEILAIMQLIADDGNKNEDEIAAAKRKLSNRKLLKITMLRKYPVEREYLDDKDQVYQYFLTISGEKDCYNKIYYHDEPRTVKFINIQKKLRKKFKTLGKSLYETKSIVQTECEDEDDQDEEITQESVRRKEAELLETISTTQKNLDAL